MVRSCAKQELAKREKDEKHALNCTPKNGQIKLPRKAFVSYANPDREKVYARLQGMKHTAPFIKK